MFGYFIVTMLVLLSLVLIALWFSQSIQSQRQSELSLLASQNGWLFQRIGGLPRFLVPIFLSENHKWRLISVNELRQHGNTLQGRLHGRTFYCCDFSLVNQSVSTQTLVMITAHAEQNENKNINTRDSIQLMCSKPSFSDSFDPPRSTTMQDAMNYEFPLASIQPTLTHIIQSSVPLDAPPASIIDLASKDVQFEYRENTLILYKSDLILTAEQLPIALEEAITVYEDITALHR